MNAGQVHGRNPSDMAAEEQTVPHDDFTVAWICALPLEMAAAIAMLDKRFQELPTDSRDHNTYILGRIKSHNIVIACLPSGVYGTISASILASQTQHTFKSIRYNLMVGIGGGVPSKQADIRLGDVVVSKPSRDFGGVIQYDYGKTVGENKFQRTGMLNKPPPILLTAISKMQAQHMLGYSQISRHLITASTDLPSSRDMFTYCGMEQDILFDPIYDHWDEEKSCERCDKKMIIERPPRANNGPVVHYGLIASGNQVMKHAPTRDTLGKELGILCFEMEASGLMDNFPCLVIRGICDYADSHKNKMWQKYAAATAAAYAKELLCLIHPSWSRQMPVANSIIKLNPHYWSLQTRAAGPLVQSLQLEEEVESMLQRISSYDHEKIHQRLSRKRLAGTTQWFTDHPKFRNWFEKKQFPCLWCTGKIGSGKTIVASTIIEMAKCRAENGTLTVFFYCGEANGENQAMAVMSSLVKQICDYLLSTSSPIPQRIEREMKKYFGPKRMKPDFEDIENIFSWLFPHVPNTIYVLDGLDLAESGQARSILKCFRSLFCDDNSSHGSQILLVSREQIPGFISISTFFPGIQIISTSANVFGDIELYIEEGMNDKMMMRRLTDDMNLLSEMKLTLMTESSAMFLWVYLQMEIIWDTCFTDAEIRSALQSLPKDLEETYRRCMHRIDLHDPRTLKTLTWVSFANNSLHIEELKEAVAFSLYDTNWDKEQLPRTDFILGSCANLITMDPTDYSIHFAHSSVKQYLAKDSKDLCGFPLSRIEGDLKCGEFCIAYLSFSDFSLQLDRPRKTTALVRLPDPVLVAQKAVGFSFNSRLLGQNGGQRRPTTISFNIIPPSPKPDGTKYRFLDYAIGNWALHTRDITTESPLWNKYERLATTFSETWNFHSWVPSSPVPSSQIHAMFAWAVVEQHEPLLLILANHASELQHICNNPLSEDGLPALHLASKSGWSKSVQMLLGICDINRKDREGYAALHYAAAKGHVSIVNMLMEKEGINVDIRSDTGLNPLWLAASNGHDEVLEVLLQNTLALEGLKHCPLLKTNIEATNPVHRTPLIEAAKRGHLKAVELLIYYGADYEARDESNRTALTWAIKERHQKVVRFLSPLFMTWIQKTKFRSEDILLMASKQGDEALVRKLLTIETININAKDTDHRTSLSWAAGNGHIAVVELLLGKGAMTESIDIYGNSALDWASSNAKYGAITTLLVQKTINNLIELSFTPCERRKTTWSGYMMSSNLAGHNGVWRYFVLRGDSLAVYKSWATVSEDGTLKSLDMRLYTPVMTRPHCDLCRLPYDGSRLEVPKSSVGYNDQLYHFFLIHGSHTTSGRLADHFDERRQCCHFAVTTERERIDWMRELGLVENN